MKSVRNKEDNASGNGVSPAQALRDFSHYGIGKREKLSFSR